MKESQILVAFGKALIEKPLSIIFFILDIIGAIVVIRLVVDNLLKAIVVIVFLLAMLTSFYLIFRKYWTISQASPRVIFDQVRQAQMYQPSQILDRKIPTYQLLQAWFRNIPAFPSESSAAREVTAKIVLVRPDGTSALEYYGQWAKSNAPDNVGFDSFIDKTDILPGHLRAKLMVALKYPAESQCYAFAREGFLSDPSGRSPRYAIPEGDYEVRVELGGIGIDSAFKFCLTNRGAKHELEFSELAESDKAI